MQVIREDTTGLKYKEKKIDKLENTLRIINRLLLYIGSENSLYKKSCETILNIDNYDLIQLNINNNRNGYSNILATKSDTIFKSLKVRDAIILGKGKTNVVKFQKGDLFGVGDVFEQFDSVLEVPIKYRRKEIGLMKVYSYTKDVFDREDDKYLREIVDDISIGVSSLRFEQQSKEKYTQLKKVLYEFMDALGEISDKRDPYTAGHQKRVALISGKIAKELNLEEKTIEGLYVTGLLHDIGKICVPLSILNKPGKLNENEIGLIQGHCIEAYNVLKNIAFPWPVAQIIFQHHEREDGSGYPNGLGGPQILIEAKILAVADVLEAMSSHRSYRPAAGLKEAIKELKKNRGKLFDKKVVDACLGLYKGKRLDFLK